MLYHEIAPSQELSHIVNCYWIVKGQGSHPGYHRVDPDGCSDIIFNLGKNPTAACCGFMTRHMKVHILPGLYDVGIRFHVGGLNRLISIPMDEICNEVIDADNIWKQLARRLREKQSIPGLIRMIETVLKQQLHLSDLTPDSLCLKVAGAVQRHRGMIRFHDIGKHVHLSQRQLERRFKNFSGVSLKKYMDIMRFAHVIRQIRSTNNSLMNIAFDAGFHDQSHLTRHIKKYSGQNPSDFR